MDAQLLNQTWQHSLAEWGKGERARLEIEIGDLCRAKQQAEVKLQKIEKRIKRVEKRLWDLGP